VYAGLAAYGKLFGELKGMSTCFFLDLRATQILAVGVATDVGSASWAQG